VFVTARPSGRRLAWTSAKRPSSSACAVCPARVSHSGPGASPVALASSDHPPEAARELRVDGDPRPQAHRDGVAKPSRRRSQPCRQVDGQVADAGLHAAGAGQRAIPVIGRPPARVPGQPGPAARRAHARAGHPERPEQQVREQVLVGTAGRPLEDQAEQLVAEAGVGPPASGLPGDRAEAFLGALGGERPVRVRAVGRMVRRLPRQARGMGGQLAERDVRVLAGVEPTAGRVIERQRAFQGENGQQGRGHGLGDGADLEPGIGGQALGGGDDRPVAVERGHRHHDAVARERAVHRAEHRPRPFLSPSHELKRYVRLTGWRRRTGPPAAAGESGSGSPARVGLRGYASYLSWWRSQLITGPSLRPAGCSQSS
jgi:hypothetical protein